MFLFSEDPIRCFETFASVDEDFLCLLARFDLLSFDYLEPGVTEEMIVEVIFLKTIINSGFSFIQVLKMLDQLQKPYRYDLTRIYWDLSLQKWRHIEEFRQTNAQEEVATNQEDEIIELLRDIKSLGDFDALHIIHNSLHELLEEENGLFN
jgi:hypothetical protein